MKNKQIVFINQSSGYLMIDIIHAFEHVYEERVLMAGFLNPRNRQLDAGIKFEKLALYNRSSSIKRIITWLLAFIKALYLIKTKYRRADLFIVSNPPMATLLPLFCINPFSILVYDVYPDALMEFKIFNERSFLVRWWQKANQNIFAKSKGIYTLTDGMKDRLAKYVSSEKIKVIPVWTDNDFLKPVAKPDNIFLKEQELQGKFIVMYSGNLGKSHPVEVMVDLAREMKDDPSVFFLVIGEGDKRELIQKRIQDSGLHNIRLLPWQTTDRLPHTFSAAGLALVTLGNEASELSIPSKTYNFMSVGVPVLCVADKASALAALIKKYSMGETFAPENISAMSSFIGRCASDASYLNNLKIRSAEASKDYTPENAKLFL